MSEKEKWNLVSEFLKARGSLQISLVADEHIKRNEKRVRKALKKLEGQISEVELKTYKDGLEKMLDEYDRKRKVNRKEFGLR